MTANLKRAAAFYVGISVVVVAMNAAEPWQVVSVNKFSWEGTLKEGTEFEPRIELKEPKEASANYFGAVDQPILRCSLVAAWPG